MGTHRNLLPIVLAATGLLGMIFFLVALRRGWPIMPTSDFAKGLWFGLCLGIGILGMLLFPKGKAGRKA